MKELTPDQYSRLKAIKAEALELWGRLGGLEVQAYGITNEKEQNGHTTDFIYQSDCNVEDLIERLKCG